MRILTIPIIVFICFSCANSTLNKPVTLKKSIVVGSAYSDRYYPIMLYPTKDEDSETGFYRPKNLKEAYLELSKILPHNVKRAFIDAGTHLSSKERNLSTARVNIDLLHEELAVSLSGLVERPEVFLVDLEAFLSRAWNINVNTALLQEFDGGLVGITEVGSLIIALYTWNEMGIEINRNELILDLRRFNKPFEAPNVFKVVTCDKPISYNEAYSFIVDMKQEEYKPERVIHYGYCDNVLYFFEHDLGWYLATKRDILLFRDEIYHMVGDKLVKLYPQKQ